MSKRDLGEEREENENVCIYTIFFRFIRTRTHFIHLSLYKSERGEGENENDKQDSESK